MSINLGAQVIPQFKLGVINLNQIMLGTIEIFPNLVPSSGLSFVETQVALENVTTDIVPIDCTNLLAGDTVVVIIRSDNASPASATITSGTIARFSNRANGFADMVSIWIGTITPAQAGQTGIVMTLPVSTNLFADVLVVRGKELTTAFAQVNSVNTGTLNVPSGAVPTGNGDSLLIAGFNGTTTNPTTITDTTCSLPISGNMGVPKLGLTGLICIVKQEDLIDAVLTQEPVASGQMIVGMWFN